MSSGMVSPTQRFTFAWPMRTWICLSNGVSIGRGRRWRRSLPTGAPWASMPTASMTESGPRPPVVPRMTSATSSAWAVRSRTSMPRGAPALQALGDEVDADDAVAAVVGDPRRHGADRPEAEDDDGAAAGDPGVLDRLPGRRQHVGQQDEPLVGRTVGDRDRRVLRCATRRSSACPPDTAP
jgi:hypothetical protein